MNNKELEEYKKKYGFGLINQPVVDLKIDDEILDLVTAQYAYENAILPWKINIEQNGEKSVTLLTCNPNVLEKQRDIILNMSDETISSIDIVLIGEEYLREGIKKFYELSPNEELYDATQISVVENMEEKEETSDEDIEMLENANSPVVTIVNQIIKSAVQKKASDIHIEPEDSGSIVKYRIDGTLVPQDFNITEKIKKAVVSRIKIMSKLDVSKKRDTQDGSMTISYEGTSIDFRVSVIPVINGEKIVLRILDKQNSLLELEHLGFEPAHIKLFNKLINKPTGIILITGPTGSGKSTTLYSFLNRLDSVSKNITTVENPVEYQLQGINQIQVSEKHVKFADALRAILRQDPNVIMLGEIRDKETAENAVQAAQTGHLVFSTLHTNDSVAVINRLKRLGVEEDAISQCLTCVIAQRLVKKICPYCQEEYVPDFDMLDIKESDVEFLKDKHPTFVHGKGCDRCDHTGYKGRTTVYEFFAVNDNIRQLIESGKSVYEIKEYLRNKDGMRSMWRKGLELVKDDITTIEEVAHEVIET